MREAVGKGGGQLEAPAAQARDIAGWAKPGGVGVEQNLGDEVRFTDCPERKNDRTAHWLLKLSSGSGTLILFLLTSHKATLNFNVMGENEAMFLCPTKGQIEYNSTVPMTTRLPPPKGHERKNSQLTPHYPLITYPPSCNDHLLVNCIPHSCETNLLTNPMA